MSRIPALSGATRGGLYQSASRVPATAIAPLAEQHGWRGAALDGAAITDRAALFDACAAALALPAYFGRNLDALADCLMDEQWLRADGFLLLYHQPQPLLAADPALWSGLLAVLADTAQFWATQQRPFIAVIRPPLPALPYPRLRLR